MQFIANWYGGSKQDNVLKFKDGNGIGEVKYSGKAA